MNIDITSNDILALITVYVFGGLFLALRISVKNNKKFTAQDKRKQDILEADTDEFLYFWQSVEHDGGKARRYSFSEVVDMHKLQEALVYGNNSNSDSFYQAIFRQLVSMRAIEADVDCVDLVISYYLASPVARKLQ